MSDNEIYFLRVSIYVPCMCNVNSVFKKSYFFLFCGQNEKKIEGTILKLLYIINRLLFHIQFQHQFFSNENVLSIFVSACDTDCDIKIPQRFFASMFLCFSPLTIYISSTLDSRYTTYNSILKGHSYIWALILFYFFFWIFQASVLATIKGTYTVENIFHNPLCSTF